MVKFSKQFEDQLIPEWKQAFVDYSELKKELKKFHLVNHINNIPNKQNSNACSAYNYLISSLKKYSLFGHQHTNHGPIQVLLPPSNNNMHNSRRT